MTDTWLWSYPFNDAPLEGNTDTGGTRFGFEWRLFLFPVGGFRIHMHNDRIHMIENLLASTIDTERTTYGIRASIKDILLAPDEFVCRVDAAFENEEMCGIRFRTNMRVSPWYGHTSTDIFVFRANTGCCIKAIQGTLKHQIARFVGVVQSPLPWETEITQTTIISSIEFSELVGSPRQSDVLQDSYSIFDAVEDDQVLTLSKNEHWVILAKSERLVGVDVVVGEYGIESLRFTTTRCTSLWYEKLPLQSDSIVSLKAPDGMYIVGFRRSGLVVRQFGAAYAPCSVVQEEK